MIKSGCAVQENHPRALSAVRLLVNEAKGPLRMLVGSQLTLPRASIVGSTGTRMKPFRRCCSVDLIGRRRRLSSDRFDSIAQDNAEAEECGQRTGVNQEQFLPLVPLVLTPDHSPLP
jgi:hypothetical protein